MTRIAAIIMCIAAGLGPVTTDATPKVTSLAAFRYQSPPDTLPLPPRKAELPPGMAKIKAEITDTTTQKKLLILSLQVDTILGYGHSTPPLAPGQRVQVKISRALVESVSALFPDGLPVSVIAAIMHSPVPDLWEVKPPEWELSGIKKQNSE